MLERRDRSFLVVQMLKLELLHESNDLEFLRDWRLSCVADRRYFRERHSSSFGSLCPILRARLKGPDIPDWAWLDT